MVDQYALCAVDRHYLQTVIETFGDPALSREGLGLVAISLGLAAALMGVYFLQRRYRARRALEPVNWLTRPAHIRSVMDRALQARSPVELSFEDNQSRRVTTQCTLLDLGEGEFFLEPPYKTGFTESMTGRTMRCFFGAPSDKSKVQKVFYTGVCPLLEVQDRGMGVKRLRMGAPVRLSVSQKREHLRLTPPSKFMGRVVLWSDSLGSRTAFEAAAKGDRVRFPRSPKVKLIDLSAGGMALEAVYENRRQRKEESPAVGDDCYLMFEVVKPGGLGVRPFFVSARPRQRLELGLTAQLRLKFTHHVYPDPKKPDFLHWERLGSDGLVELDDWIVARHLELFRKHGHW